MLYYISWVRNISKSKSDLDPNPYPDPDPSSLKSSFNVQASVFKQLIILVTSEFSVPGAPYVSKHVDDNGLLMHSFIGVRSVLREDRDFGRVVLAL